MCYAQYDYFILYFIYMPPSNEIVSLEYFRPHEGYISAIDKACTRYNEAFRNGGQDDIQGVQDVFQKFALYLEQELKGQYIKYAEIENIVLDVQVAPQLYDFGRIKPVIRFIFENNEIITLEHQDLRCVKIVE